jgi:AbrB family looped-hinge helix DNA binding protein
MKPIIPKTLLISEYNYLYSDNKMIVKGIVGKKGELFPPKEIRDMIGLKSGSEVIYRVEKSRLIIEPVPDILTAIKMPKFAKTTVKEFEKERKEIAGEVIRR